MTGKGTSGFKSGWDSGYKAGSSVGQKWDTTIVDTAKNVGKWVNNNIVEPIKNTYNFAKQEIKNVSQKIQQGYQEIKQAATIAIRQTKEYIQQRTAEIKKEVIKFSCGVADKISNAWESITTPPEQTSPEYGTYYGDNDKLSTLGFAIRHPFIAAEIGDVQSGSTNISTNSSRFAWDFDLQKNDFGIPDQTDEGSEIGAFRHIIWQATITNKYGGDIALQVGNAHEKNPNVLNEISDIYNHKFDDLSAVDEAIDLLNNIEGRKIGINTSQGATMKDIAGDVLDYFYENGFNVAVKRDDEFYIEKQTLTKERYENNKMVLKTLDDVGYPPDNEHYNK